MFEKNAVPSLKTQERRERRSYDPIVYRFFRRALEPGFLAAFLGLRAFLAGFFFIERAGLRACFFIFFLFLERTGFLAFIFLIFAFFTFAGFFFLAAGFFGFAFLAGLAAFLARFFAGAGDFLAGAGFGDSALLGAGALVGFAGGVIMLVCDGR